VLQLDRRAIIVITPQIFLQVSFGDVDYEKPLPWWGARVGWKADWKAPVGICVFQKRRRWDFGRGGKCS
jgi:hypothetical protein